MPYSTQENTRALVEQDQLIRELGLRVVFCPVKEPKLLRIICSEEGNRPQVGHGSYFFTRRGRRDQKGAGFFHRVNPYDFFARGFSCFLVPSPPYRKNPCDADRSRCFHEPRGRAARERPPLSLQRNIPFRVCFFRQRVFFALALSSIFRGNCLEYEETMKGKKEI
jgi:hypothetical protein